MVIEIIDEGKKAFNLKSRSSGMMVLDLIGEPLAGRGIGMGYIMGSADDVRVLPLLNENGKGLRGNKVVLKKYFRLPRTL